MIADLVTCIEALFIFALVWSVGATTNEDGRYCPFLLSSLVAQWSVLLLYRKMYDAFLREELQCNKFAWPFPKGGGMVYDFLFLTETKKWVKWMEIIDKFEIDPKLSFSEIIVPTNDSVRNTYLLDLLLSNDKHVLMVGATGE